SSYTALVGERPPSADLIYGWWFAGGGQKGNGSCDVILGSRELNVAYKDCPKGPYGYGPGTAQNQCDQFHFWSFHLGGANFLMADGSVRVLGYSTGAPILDMLATRGGGETIPTF